MKRLPYGQHFVDEDDIAAVADVLRHGWLTQGPKVTELEEALARYVGARYAVAVSNGTAALHLACIAAGLKSGDTLVTSPNTFVASANCALYVGARPDFCDIDPQTLNLDPLGLERRFAESGAPRVVVPVHFAGFPCDMIRIRRAADAGRALVIEDASHALGAVYTDGKRVGCCAHSDMTVFSFHPVKMIAMGEGGMITTNNESLYRDLLRLRSHGINKGDDPYVYPSEAYSDGAANPWYYEMQELGYNYRITDIQCALGLSQLRKIERFLARRRALALRYDRLLAEVPHLTLTQTDGRGASSHHLYVVRIDFEAVGTTRGAVMHALRRQGIVSQVHYIPVHTHPYYRKNGHAKASYPNSESYYRQALSLPLYFGLSDEDQDFVVTQIRALAGCA
jgi:UDP-4-amino-4,6-dideoxy-N-acetyl-beta-L-altrosamine transaminase